MIRSSYNEESKRQFGIQSRIDFTHDMLALPMKMTKKGRASMDEIAELLFYNPTISRIKVFNKAERRMRNRKRKSRTRKFLEYTAHKFVRKAGLHRSALGRGLNYIAPEEGVVGDDDYSDDSDVFPEEDEYADLRKTHGPKMKNRPWDSVDIFKLRQNLSGRVEEKDKNWG